MLVIIITNNKIIIITITLINYSCRCHGHHLHSLNWLTFYYNHCVYYYDYCVYQSSSSWLELRVSIRIWLHIETNMGNNKSNNSVHIEEEEKKKKKKSRDCY